MKRKLLAMLLVVVMVFSMLGTTTFASDCGKPGCLGGDTHLAAHEFTMEIYTYVEKSWNPVLITTVKGHVHGHENYDVVAPTLSALGLSDTDFKGISKGSYAYNATYKPGFGVDVPYGNEVELYYHYKAQEADKTVTLSYNANGGIDAPGADSETVKGSQNANFTISNEKPTKDNCEFLGWSENPQATSATYTGGQSVSFGTNITLYAVWKEIPQTVKYTVTYNDGVDLENVFEDESFTVEDGKETPACTRTLDRTGYVFAGWCPLVAEKVTETVTYTATWEEDANGNGTADKDEQPTAPTQYNYEIRYILNGGNIDGETGYVTKNATSDVDTGHDFTAEDLGATRTDYNDVEYVCLGWADSVSATEPDYRFGDEITATYGAVKKVYAVWAAKPVEVTKHTVTFETHGGTAVPTQEVEDGEKATQPTAPTKTDFEFGGWYSDDECKTPYDFTTSVTNDITVYAKWTAKPVAPTEYKYELRYILNGGYIGDSSAYVTKTATANVNTGYDFTAEDLGATRTDYNEVEYVCLGWADSVSATEPDYKFGHTINAPYGAVKKVYAVWAEDKNKNDIADEDETKYTVTYNDGVTGEEVFADQPTSDILSGTATPAFVGTPARTGYVFTGWYPEVAETVTATVTYAAQWAEDVNGDGQNDGTQEKYSVTYTGGVEGEDVFTDEVTNDILPGTATPAFAGDTTREGYVFAGWNPEVAETVDATVIYVAQWLDDANNNGEDDTTEEKYTVTYTDGVEGAVFADQVTNDILSGSETPAFKGTPERSGYLFKGWDNDNTVKVTADATYTATWKKKTTSTSTTRYYDVTTTYVDEDGNEIAATDVQKNIRSGKAYTTEKLEITGYTFVETQGDAPSGTVRSDKKVIYVYQKDVAGDVTNPQGPTVDIPDVDVPQTNTPDTNVPEVVAPEVNVPETETPKTEAPTVEIPEVEVPLGDSPDTGDARTASHFLFISLLSAAGLVWILKAEMADKKKKAQK